MALRRKGSAPWSLTKDTGLSDAPVSGSPFVEGDEVKPVIDAGYIDAKGLWQISPSSDTAFTFQDPDQALTPGADMEFDIDMIKHDTAIIAIVDTSGNTINIDLEFRNPTTLTGIYAPFAILGANGSKPWQINSVYTSNTDSFFPILQDNNDTLAATWQFYKVVGLKGCLARFLIHNNDGSNAGTISSAYMRLV